MTNISENSNCVCPVAPLWPRRYQVLQEVEAVGSVAEVCRREGITRQTYYLWKRRYVTSGLLGFRQAFRHPGIGLQPVQSLQFRPTPRAFDAASPQVQHGVRIQDR